MISPRIVADDLFSTFPKPTCAFVTLWGFEVLEVWEEIELFISDTVVSISDSHWQYFQPS